MVLVKIWAKNWQKDKKKLTLTTTTTTLRVYFFTQKQNQGGFFFWQEVIKEITETDIVLRIEPLHKCRFAYALMPGSSATMPPCLGGVFRFAYDRVNRRAGGVCLGWVVFWVLFFL